MIPPTTSDDAVRLTRTIEASPDEVYRAFLDPALLSKWFGPSGFDVVEADVDARVGGHHRTVLTGPDGIRGSFACELRELVPGERIVMTWRWVFETPASRADPQESLLTITLREAAPGATLLTLVHDRLGVHPPEDRESVRGGWTGALDKLASIYEGGGKQ